MDVFRLKKDLEKYRITAFALLMVLGIHVVMPAAVLLLFFLSWSIIPQQIPSAILPLLLLLGFRSIKKQSESLN